MAKLENLPSEVILQIVRFFDPLDIVNLQLVSRRFLDLGRDDAIWRDHCFASSSFLTNLQRLEPRFRGLLRALTGGNELGDSSLALSREEGGNPNAISNERIRILANWDPSYPTEKVDWYSEYIARNAPICTSWLQQPRNRESPEHEYVEVRGMGLYTPAGDDDATFVVAPLDDGSVCLWDITGNKGKKGSIVARSKRGLLSVDPAPQIGSNRRSKMINTGVTECVSVDSGRKKAFFAVQSCLVEVDLETMSLVSCERFSFSITALSEVKHPVPLTVGTNLSLHLHDSRVRRSSGDLVGNTDRLDSYNSGFGSIENARSLDFRSLLNPEPSSLYAHPAPLSILHIPRHGDEWDVNGDIYIAGRFPSILNYDRRYFPKLRGTIHSGAQLCSLAYLPYPFTSLNNDLARRCELTIEQVLEAKTRPGNTLIACGEYKSKGSLEMYGLAPNASADSKDTAVAGSLQNSVLKNRQTSSSSKLLSASNHGTRIVVSDGGGNVKWLERDGFTQVRRWNIGHGSIEARRGIFGVPGGSYMDSGSGDIAIKLTTTYSGRNEKPVNEDDLVLWTGEKLGLLSFSRKPGFTAEDFEEIEKKTPEEAHRERQERNYSETMGRALEANANEVRWMRGLGLGLSE